MKQNYYKRDKSKTIIASLIIIVLILLGILAWIFIARPTINAYILEKQQQAYIQGQSEIIQEILKQIQQTGSVAIPISETQSIILDLRMPEQTA